MSRRPRTRCLVVVAVAVAAAVVCAHELLLQPLDGPGAAPPPPWHLTGLPGQKKPYTQFTLAEVDGRRGLRIEAHESYGNLVHALAPTVHAYRLAWAWRVDEPNEAADLTQRSGDDSPVKVCVLFDLPLTAVPFFERQLLRFARSRSAEPVPAATVCYLWDAKLATGTTLANAFTRRIRGVVLEGKGAPLHQWLNETRDVRADFLALFGDEAREVPPLMGIAVGADSDNTHRHSVAHVAHLALAP